MKEPPAATVAGSVPEAGEPESHVLPAVAGAIPVSEMVVPVLFCRVSVLVALPPLGTQTVRLEGVTEVEPVPPEPGVNVTLMVAAAVLLPMGVSVTVPWACEIRP
jgi:hypothetical protein